MPYYRKVCPLLAAAVSLSRRQQREECFPVIITCQLNLNLITSWTDMGVCLASLLVFNFTKPFPAGRYKKRGGVWLRETNQLHQLHCLSFFPGPSVFIDIFKNEDFSLLLRVLISPRKRKRCCPHFSICVMSPV